SFLNLDWDCAYSSHRKHLRLHFPLKKCVFAIKSINCDVCVRLFYAADRCFPRARLHPPRETRSAGSSDTCYSRRSQRSSATNNHRKSESDPCSIVAEYHVSEGNTRRLLEKENHFFCVRCFSKKLSLSCGKAKTMRPHSERSLRVRRLIASPRKA